MHHGRIVPIQQFSVRGDEIITSGIVCVVILQFVFKIRRSGKQCVLQVIIIQRLKIDIILDLKDPVTKKALRPEITTESLCGIHDTLDSNDPLQLEIPDFLEYSDGIFRSGPFRHGQHVDKDICVQKNLNSQHIFSRDIPTWDQRRTLRL